MQNLESEFPVQKKSGNLREVLQIIATSVYFIMFTYAKEKVVVTSVRVCCFFLNQMTYLLNNKDGYEDLLV